MSDSDESCSHTIPTSSSGMWTPSQVLFRHFLHFVEPLPQSHEVEIISCLFGQRSSLKPQPTSPVLSSTPAGHTHNKVVIYVTGVSHVLCQTCLGRLKASLGHLHLYTLLHTHRNWARKLTFAASLEH